MKNLLIALAIAACVSSAVLGQSAQQVIEAARAKAQETAAYREALSDPDQSVRLTTFEAMIATGNPTLVDLAIDTSLTSSDRTLRALALKHAVLSRRELSVVLALDPSQQSRARQEAEGYLRAAGNQYTVVLANRDPDLTSGTFRANGLIEGTVSGLTLTFANSSVKARFELQDDTTLAGTMFIKPHRIQGGEFVGGQFLASIRLR